MRNAPFGAGAPHVVELGSVADFFHRVYLLLLSRRAFFFCILLSFSMSMLWKTSSGWVRTNPAAKMRNQYAAKRFALQGERYSRTRFVLHLKNCLEFGP